MTNDENEPQVLTSVPSDVEASVIVSALAACAIEATTTGDFISGFRAEAPSQVQVVVRAIDLDRAKVELERIQAGESDIDWAQIDCGEPEDGACEDPAPD